MMQYPDLDKAFVVTPSPLARVRDASSESPAIKSGAITISRQETPKSAPPSQPKFDRSTKPMAPKAGSPARIVNGGTVVSSVVSGGTVVSGGGSVSRDVMNEAAKDSAMFSSRLGATEGKTEYCNATSVSYTHLTLPTNREV